MIYALVIGILAIIWGKCSQLTYRFVYGESENKNMDIKHKYILLLFGILNFVWIYAICGLLVYFHEDKSILYFIGLGFVIIYPLSIILLKIRCKKQYIELMNQMAKEIENPDYHLYICPVCYKVSLHPQEDSQHTCLDDESVLLDTGWSKLDWKMAKPHKQDKAKEQFKRLVVEHNESVANEKYK